MAKTATATPVDEAKAEEYRERAEADFDPAETAAARLARLEEETAAQLKEARKAVREERKQVEAEEFEKVVEPELKKIDAILAGIEEETGKIFRTFSFYYKFPKGAEKANVKIKHSLVTPRGESTEDDEE